MGIGTAKSSSVVLSDGNSTIADILLIWQLSITIKTKRLLWQNPNSELGCWLVKVYSHIKLDNDDGKERGDLLAFWFYSLRVMDGVVGEIKQDAHSEQSM